MKWVWWVLMFTAACGTARSEPNRRGFEFVQGVIVDGLHSLAYMSNAQAGIDVVRLSDGEVIATSPRGAKPLLLYNDVLLTAAPEPIDALHIIGLTGRDLKPKFELEVPLPGQVRGGSFYVGARMSDSQIIVDWRSIRRPFSAVPTHEAGVVTNGFARIDPATGRLIAAAQGEPPVPRARRSEIPAAVQKLADEGGLASPLCLADDLVAALQYVEKNGDQHMILRRWSKATGKVMPDVTPFDSEMTFRNFSPDCRYLLASKAIDGWVWQIYSTATGQQVAKIHNPLPGPEFFISGNNLIYRSPAAGQAIAGRLIVAPPRLVAISLDDGRELWARPIGETTFVGPYPGNPPVPSAPQPISRSQ